MEQENQLFNIFFFRYVSIVDVSRSRQQSEQESRNCLLFTTFPLEAEQPNLPCTCACATALQA